jgi:TonB-linked SusC/RagA family outer membrane protein
MCNHPKTKSFVALFLLLFCLCPMIHAQGKLITVNLKNATLKEVFNTIEKQTSYRFSYRDVLLDNRQDITISKKQVSVQTVLNEALRNRDLEYSILSSKSIVISAKKTSSNSSVGGAKRKITGIVKDAAGQAVIGASVMVQGTKVGAITDVDGKFSFDGPENGTLVVSYIGYSDQKVSINEKRNLDITLKENVKELNEVVVVGYGVQKKVNLTGSVSSVKGDELMHRPVVDATQSLQGLVPGLLVTNNSSGRPGASGTLTLRGQGNLANNANPYILVDGVEMSLSDVNPNDIENISVLKDAAACAIYGARAAYGVILVTTKKGEEGKTRVSYQGTVGWTSPTVLPTMANAYDFATYFNTACENAGFLKQYSDEKLEKLQQYMADPSSVNPWYELTGNESMNPAFENTGKGVGNVDYFKLHYKNHAFKQNHNLSFSGGNKTIQYYVSGGYYQEDGILRYADINYSRLNFNSNISSQLTKWLTMKVNTKFVHSDNNTPFGDGGLSEGFYHSLARFRPTISPIDPNGHFTELTMIPYLQSGTYTNTKRDHLALSTNLEAQPVKNWRIFFDYTYRSSDSQYKALNVAPLIYAADGVTTSKGARDELSVVANGRFTRATTKNSYQLLNLYTNYMFSLDKHNFTLLGGFQEEDFHYSYLKNSVTDLYTTTNPGLGLGSGDKTIVDTRNAWATRGFFGRLNYDYDGRYLVELDGRYDGSSRFASGHRWGFFPSISLGWNIAHESFMAPISDVLSNLKLRLSYGRLGNQNGAALYTFASTMSISSKLGGYIFSDGRHTYTLAPGVVDPNTTWEKVDSKNLGLDFGFFGNSLTGTFDIFQRDTKDMLGPTADYADIFGATSPNTNNARMRNRGWELTLNYRGKIGKDITYSIGGSLSDATSEVTRYENPTGTDPANNWYVNKKVGEIWGYRADGLIQTQAEADQYNSTYNLSYLTGKSWTPGDLKYRDLDGDKAINKGTNILGKMGDYTIIGNSTPRYQYTLNGSISWKGITLSMMWQGVGKRDWMPTLGTAYFWGAGSYAQVTVFKQTFRLLDRKESKCLLSETLHRTWRKNCKF